jgi:hypothetical protein
MRTDHLFGAHDVTRHRRARLPGQRRAVVARLGRKERRHECLFDAGHAKRRGEQRVVAIKLSGREIDEPAQTRAEAGCDRQFRREFDRPRRDIAEQMS